MSKKIVTRFAPSPTGFMHIGGIRTALFAYLYAKKHNGTFILRIEDTDKSREVDGSIDHIKESLRWLGIEYDFGPDKVGDFGSALQSDRLDIYREYAQKLVTKGLAYPDPYSSEEIDTFREQAKENKKPFLFRDHRPDTFEVWDGTKPLRLKVPEIKRYHWHDQVRGDLEAGEEMLDDVVLIKSDGYPTYNFAHIVDDYLMGVTHVMRGDEFISSMPKFLSIYDALEIPYPEFVSLPPIMNEGGNKKLGKRDGAKDILEYKQQGYLPQTMMNFLALVGWNPGTSQELFSKEELIQAFSLEGIQVSGAAFNEEKLLWMNKEYYKLLPESEYIEMVLSVLDESVTTLPLFTAERLQKLLPTIRERVSLITEVADAARAGEYQWAFDHITVDTDIVAWKNDTSASDAVSRLRKASGLLQEADFSSSETIKAALWPYAEEVGKGELLWPLRVSLTGREQSPDPFIVAYVLGPEETIARIEAVCDKIES